MADHTIQEILSQPKVWRSTLELMRNNSDLLQEAGPLIGNGQVLFTGCGSSYYLALSAAAIWSRIAGGAASALSATDVMMYPEAHFVPGAPGTVFAISRSGKTPETAQAVRCLRQSHGWKAIGMTCYEDMPLAAECDRTLVFSEAAEISRFTTRVLTSKILAVSLLAARRAKNAEFERELETLPSLAEGIMTREGGRIQRFAGSHNFDQYVFLGQGPYFGLASELMLKVKEICRAPAEAYHSLEYIHGPRFAATPSTLIVLLLSDGGAQHQAELLPKLKATGARIVVVCERATAEVGATADFAVELNSGLSDYGRLLLAMPPMQLFAYYRALALGKAAWIEEMVRLPDPRA